MKRREGRGRRPGMGWLWVLAWATAAAPAADTVRLVCRFDGGLYAREGAANPFPAAGNVQPISVSERAGGAARFAGHDPDAEGRRRRSQDRSAMVWDAANLPLARGTIGFHLRWTGQRHPADGRATWLAVLPPRMDEVDGRSEGAGLVVYKDSDDTLALGVYQFWKGGVRADQGSWGLPDTGALTQQTPMADPHLVAVRIPVGHLPADAWTPVRFGWDREAGRVWLGVGDDVEEAQAELRDIPWHCLVIGSPPQIQRGPPLGFDGDLTDLVIDARTPAQASRAGFEIPDPLPPKAEPGTGLLPARWLADDPVGGPMEAAVRSHLGQVLRSQGAHGGWAFSSAWPSRLSFLSAHRVLPYSEDFFNGSKDGNSAVCAIRLLTGYLTLEDPAYLEGAERTARALLKLQQPDGYWPYFAVWNPETESFDRIYRPDVAPLEDRVQAHPIVLLWLLDEITGKPEYGEAADRGRDFVLHAQNPNGSWSHQFRPAQQAGWTFGAWDAGEINDYATSDQMSVMLAAYRRTGEPRFLAAFLRGADWHVAAFIDRGAVGWAQQYDADNIPIEARHFEPAAVSLGEGISSAPQMLLRAYRLTGDRRYLDPLYRWREWMQANRIFLDEEKTRWGWHTYYDIETGEPFRMIDRQRRPVDPRSARDGGFTRLLRAVETAEEPAPPRVTTRERVRAALAEAEAAAARPEDPVFTRLRPAPLVEALDPVAGTWLFSEESPTGPKVAPNTVRVSLLSWSVLLRRQIAGQVPLDHRLSTLERTEFGSPFRMLLPPEVMDQPLTEDEIAAARMIPPARAPRGGDAAGE